MEIDITSVIIGIASLATFAVPIGYDQFKVKRTKRKAEEQFLNKATDLGFESGSFDVLPNHATIGIDKNSKELLYVKNSADYHLFELCSVKTCSSYKTESILTGDDGLKQSYKEMGIKLSAHRSSDIKLPIFEGRDGTQHGDESLIIERLMTRINKAIRTLKESETAATTA